MPRKNLTLKQEGFARDYVLTGNASQAYRSNYNAGKMKPETINVKAIELLKNGKVAVRVNELQKDIAQRAKEQFEIDADWILKETHQQYLRCIGAIETHHVAQTKFGPDPYTHKVFNAQAANRALEMLGNHTQVRAYDKTVRFDNEGITFHLNYGAPPDED